MPPAAPPPSPRHPSFRPPRVGVLALQGAFREHRQAFERLGAEVVEVRKPEHLDGLAGVVIPGGRVDHDGQADGDLRPRPRAARVPRRRRRRVGHLRRRHRVATDIDGSPTSRASGCST
jgi:hypothetical protein